MSTATSTLGILASILAVILASVVVAYTTQSGKQQNQQVEGTRLFLKGFSIFIIIVSLIYWGVAIYQRKRVIGETIGVPLAF